MTSRTLVARALVASMSMTSLVAALREPRGLPVAGVPTMPGALIARRAHRPARSSPGALIAAIVPPSVDASLLVALSGAFEVALGLGLLLGRWQSLVLAGIAAQMSATFLVLLLRPDVAFSNGNPLALSVEGEYVVKNLVLLAAALSLAGQHLARRRDHPSARP